MIGGRKVRSNKGKRRGSYRQGTGKIRSGTPFRGRKTTVKRRTRKVRSNKGKKRASYRRGSGRTRSGRKFRGGSTSALPQYVKSVTSQMPNKGKRNTLVGNWALLKSAANAERKRKEKRLTWPAKKASTKKSPAKKASTKKAPAKKASTNKA